MQADPDLTRTVLVTTKLDTKLPQFSEGEDLEDFLRCVRTSPLLFSPLSLISAPIEASDYWRTLWVILLDCSF